MLTLPLVPSIPEYRRAVVIDGATYYLDLRWNARDNEDAEGVAHGAWYLSIYDIDQVPVFQGVKIVLGMFLGKWRNHPLTRNGAFVAIDTSGARADAGFDDLGTRVVVLWLSQFDMAASIHAAEREGRI